MNEKGRNIQGKNDLCKQIVETILELAKKVFFVEKRNKEKKFTVDNMHEKPYT